LRDEPNLQDVHCLALVLLKRLAISLPGVFPTRQYGVKIVNVVEEAVLGRSPDHCLRFNAPHELVQLCDDLVRDVREQGLLSHGDATNLVAALLAWVGCIRMAKTLRSYDSAGQAYTDGIRRREYERLSALWNRPEGSWIRYGTTFARTLELERGNSVVDEWVPCDSPYWTGAGSDDT
jgi:hypothetical protein